MPIGLSPKARAPWLDPALSGSMARFASSGNTTPATRAMRYFGRDCNGSGCGVTEVRGDIRLRAPRRHFCPPVAPSPLTPAARERGGGPSRDLPSRVQPGAHGPRGPVAARPTASPSSSTSWSRCTTQQSAIGAMRTASEIGATVAGRPRCRSRRNGLDHRHPGPRDVPWEGSRHSLQAQGRHRPHRNPVPGTQSRHAVVGGTNQCPVHRHVHPTPRGGGHSPGGTAPQEPRRYRIHTGRPWPDLPEAERIVRTDGLTNVELETTCRQPGGERPPRVV